MRKKITIEVEIEVLKGYNDYSEEWAESIRSTALQAVQSKARRMMFWGNKFKLNFLSSKVEKE